MRPINLNLSAFGPYAGEIKLNMDDLGDKGLYLRVEFYSNGMM